jgi:hypothetical protein
LLAEQNIPSETSNESKKIEACFRIFYIAIPEEIDKKNRKINCCNEFDEMIQKCQNSVYLIVNLGIIQQAKIQLNYHLFRNQVVELYHLL